MDTLYAHQQAALTKYDKATMIPLFHEQGCGKSATTLRIIAERYKRKECDVVLIIAPNKVHTQWALEQIPLWLSDIDTFVWYSKSSNRQKLIPFVEDRLNCVCVNVEQFSTTQTYQKYVKYGLAHKTIIVLDEATRIKNPTSLRSKRILRCFNQNVMRGRAVVSSTPLTVARIALTGTPATNSPMDVWAIFEFLQPSYFKQNYYAFQRTYCMLYLKNINGHQLPMLLDYEAWLNINNCETFNEAQLKYGIDFESYDIIRKQEKYEGPYKHLEQLKQLIQKTADIVSIKDVLDMPKQVYHTKRLEMEPEQARAYKDMRDKLIAQYKGQTTTAASKISCYCRLQQIATGFITSVPDSDDDPSERVVTWFDKVPKLDQLMCDIEEIEGQVIVVTHFTAEASRIFEQLSKTYNCCLITGWKKVGSIDDFKEGKYKVMVANIRVIAFGFNLQNCCHMIFYSNTFSLEDRLQVEARIFRTGQTQTCIYTDYLMKGTIEEKIVSSLHSKQKLLDYLRNSKLEEII